MMLLRRKRMCQPGCLMVWVCWLCLSLNPKALGRCKCNLWDSRKMNRPLTWIIWIQSFPEYTHSMVHDTPISIPFLFLLFPYCSRYSILPSSVRSQGAYLVSTENETCSPRMPDSHPIPPAHPCTTRLHRYRVTPLCTCLDVLLKWLHVVSCGFMWFHVVSVAVAEISWAAVQYGGCGRRCWTYNWHRLLRCLHIHHDRSLGFPCAKMKCETLWNNMKQRMVRQMCSRVFQVGVPIATRQSGTMWCVDSTAHCSNAHMVVSVSVSGCVFQDSHWFSTESRRKQMKAARISSAQYLSDRASSLLFPQSQALAVIKYDQVVSWTQLDQVYSSVKFLNSVDTKHPWPMWNCYEMRKSRQEFTQPFASLHYM